MVKYKQPVVANADTVRAGEVAKRVQNALGNPKIIRGRKEVDKYSVAWHTKCWRHFKIRPANGNSPPEQTDIKYCIYDKRHDDYGYTEEWVKLLVAKFKDEKAYEELFTKAGGFGMESVKRNL
jgi:hypothetical protein